MMKKQTIELLAPAGSPEALDAAIGEGADAVYLGLKSFNARLRSANFAYSQFEGALRALHRMRRKVYVTVNTVFEQREADRMYQLLKYLASVGPDGIIVQDFGVLAMIHEQFPTLRAHASTQMNIASARGANALSRYGVSRVVLARELSLNEIQAIRANTNMELEVFVHGALCVSVSGLCLFSSFLGGKSANRGMCTQACRRYYREFGVEEGGYYFSPSDLQLLERLPELADAGINAVKIEGRMKSADYVGAVVSAYRRVIDALDGKCEVAIAEGQKILRGDFARTKTVFYFDENNTIDWLRAEQSGGTGIPLGHLLNVRGLFGARLGLLPHGETGLCVGDSIRLHRADDSDRQSYKARSVEHDHVGIWVSIPDGFDKGDMVYLIQTRALSRRYAPVLPRRLDAFRRAPGHDHAPQVKLLPAGKADSKRFPQGIYVAVSRIEDLYIIQSSRPVKAFLAYTRKTAAYLLADKKPPLPFKQGELILTLDPYFPEALSAIVAEEIPALVERGFRQFVVNNPGHISLFRGLSDVSLIAGPYLYTFNRYAFSFIAGLGLQRFISPLENNRQNLEKTVDPRHRDLAFITVFAYPALFRIRTAVNRVYEFSAFTDSHDERFNLVENDTGSLVIPEQAFSIVDKIPFLQEAGFSHFIQDFSGPPLKKINYKDVSNATKNALPLPHTSRFNWKDGFYQQEEARQARESNA
ncbi:MAG: U32 family peptidase [Treponema sp.]|jgi:putative protease|nr:U32 family peptidase [Treponema sp.]